MPTRFVLPTTVEPAKHHTTILFNVEMKVNNRSGKRRTGIMIAFNCIHAGAMISFCCFENQAVRHIAT